ncbi:MAG: helix-turn-helix transcriptional regulator [Azospirillum sp.]|nr:helix-turn-helix transcriptional regulator [Azospirillum sp.]
MIDTNWFQGRIKDVKKSQRELATVLGIDPAQVTNMLRGKRRMQLSEAAIIAQFLNVPVEEVLAHAGLPVNGGARRVKLVGFVDDVGEVHLSDKNEADVEAPAMAPEGTIAVRMRSNDMLMRGGLMFFKPGQGVEAGAIGRLSVCRIAAGPWLVRSIAPGLESGTYDLTGPADEIHGARLSAAVPVLWIRP